MTTTFRTAAAVAAMIAMLAPGLVAAQEGSAAPARNYAVEDDFFFTQALFCSIERCGFGSYREASAYAEAGWNELRQAGYEPALLLELACQTEGPCGVDDFTATLVAAPGARTDIVADPIPPAAPPPPAEEPAAEEIEVEVEEPERDYVVRTKPHFVRPTLQAGLQGQLWHVQRASDTGRMIVPRVMVGGMFEVVLARAVATFGVGLDEDYSLYRSFTVGGLVGPMFGDGDTRMYVAGTWGASWLQIDHLLLPGQYGGVEWGVHGKTHGPTMVSLFVGFEIHGTRLNQFVQYPDGTILHAGQPTGANFYVGATWGF